MTTPYSPEMNASQIYKLGLTESFLAAERTFCAWYRTVIAFVCFGLVLAKFWTHSDNAGKLVTLLTAAIALGFLAFATERYYYVASLMLQKNFLPSYVVPGVIGCVLFLIIFILLVFAIKQTVHVSQTDQYAELRRKARMDSRLSRYFM